MSVFNDPKYASRALMSLGMLLLGLSARFASQAQTILPIIGMYVGFVLFVRGVWLGWKYRLK